MFDENFSFGAARSPSIESSTAATADSSRSVSPCTISGPFPSPRFSVTDLAAQFAEQRIRQDSRICYDPCDAYANQDDDADWSIPSDDSSDMPLRRSQTFPQRPHSPSRRVHRQITTGLLCTTSHRRDIAALVSRMVDEEEQCSITSPAGLSLTPPPEEDEDEGYNSSDDPMDSQTSRRSSIATVQSSTNFRRASDLISGGAHVSKRVRVRKDKRRTATARLASERS